MTYAALCDDALRPSGAGSSEHRERANNDWLPVWHDLWSETLRTQSAREFSRTTTTFVICLTIEAFPVASTRLQSQVVEMLNAIEALFGDSASDLAKILRVSRPMIYHYRDGMEPSPENKRRLHSLAELAWDWSPLVAQPLKALLRARQPEGRTLLEFLSDAALDVVALRQVLHRNIATADQALRNNLAAELSREESADERQDIVRERHAAGKPVYIGDPDAPGKLIQILPGGGRIHGRMVERKFVPD
jgi:uncharacterized protein YicC (UPF0701 family)